MQISLLVAIIAVGVELVTASPVLHASSQEDLSRALQKRQYLPPDLSSTCASLLQSIGFGSNSSVPNDFGVNAEASGSEGVWIGTDGPYTNVFTNTSPDEVCLVVWGDQPPYQASFVTAVQPLITISLAAAGGSLTLSFADGQSGAWAGVYPSTVLNYGQISNTWGEFTMSPSGVVDVSREVYTQGNTMSIVGPDCTTDMTTCVFVCNDPTVTQCGAAGSYQLSNCAIGSQSGAQDNSDNTSGGCGWNGATTVQLTTTFS